MSDENNSQSNGSISLKPEFYLQIIVVIVIFGGLSFLVHNVFQLESRMSRLEGKLDNMEKFKVKIAKKIADERTATLKAGNFPLTTINMNKDQQL